MRRFARSLKPPAAGRTRAESPRSRCALVGAAGSVSFEFDRTGMVRVVPLVDPSGAPIAVSADLTQPVMIGDTGLAITATGLGFTLDPADPTISVTSARLRLTRHRSAADTKVR